MMQLEPIPLAIATRLTFSVGTGLMAGTELPSSVSSGGKVNWKVVPCPSFLEDHNRPPCNAMIAFSGARLLQPSSAPCVANCVASRTRYPA
jgi:hypothetical protein